MDKLKLNKSLELGKVSLIDLGISNSVISFWSLNWAGVILLLEEILEEVPVMSEVAAALAAASSSFFF